MYSSRPGLILAFHGCDESVVHEVVSGTQHLKESTNSWDWLGHGAYFWESSPSRALEFAHALSEKSNSQITIPTVLGAVINLGHCLDLLDYSNLSSLKTSYDILEKGYEASGFAIPRNKKPKDESKDLLIRELDCAVIETLHKTRHDEGLEPYASVRGVFWEGPLLYPDAGFREKDHIQICVRNPNCIKGFFVPRSLNDAFARV